MSDLTPVRSCGVPPGPARRRCPRCPRCSRRGRGRRCPCAGGEVFVRRTPWTGPLGRLRRSAGAGPVRARAGRGVDQLDRPRGPARGALRRLGDRPARVRPLAAAAARPVLDPRPRARRRRRPGADPSTCPATAPAGPVHLVGNSLGGLVSVLVAGPPSRPGRVADADLAGDAGLPGADGVQPGAAAAPACPGCRRWPRAGSAGITPEESVRAMIRMCFGRADAGAAGAARAGGPGDARAGRAAVGRRGRSSGTCAG